jgi:hypothetical protein
MVGARSFYQRTVEPVREKAARANVLPGIYDVKVTLQGFKEFRHTQVPVTV